MTYAARSEGPGSLDGPAALLARPPLQADGQAVMGLGDDDEAPLIDQLAEAGPEVVGREAERAAEAVERPPKVAPVPSTSKVRARPWARRAAVRSCGAVMLGRTWLGHVRDGPVAMVGGRDGWRSRPSSPRASSDPMTRRPHP